MKTFAKKLDELSEISSANLGEICYEISLNSLKRLNKEAKKSKISELFAEFSQILNERDLLNYENVRAVIDAIKRAFIKDEEDFLYDLISQLDRINRQVLNQKDEIKMQIFSMFDAIGVGAEATKFAQNSQFEKAINDAMLDETLMKEFLKEISETAFVSAIENGDDVQDMASEMAKRIVYSTAIDGEFKKKRLMKILKIVIKQAISVANASQIYAKELISGAVLGAYDGLIKTANKVKSEQKFAAIPLEIELINVDDEIITLLKKLVANAEEPAKSELEELIKKDFDNYFVKFKHLSSQTAENLMHKIEDSNLSEKFESVLNKTKNLRESLENSDKFASIKENILSFEKQFLEKLEALKKRDK